MAVFQRVNGGAQSVVSAGNVGVSTAAGSIGVAISTGVGKPLNFWSIALNTAGGNTFGSNVGPAPTLTPTLAVGTGSGVEAALKLISVEATILAYQLNTAGTTLSVMTEDSAWATTGVPTGSTTPNTTVLQSSVQSLGNVQLPTTALPGSAALGFVNFTGATITNVASFGPQS